MTPSMTCTGARGRTLPRCSHARLQKMLRFYVLNALTRGEWGMASSEIPFTTRHSLFAMTTVWGTHAQMDTFDFVVVGAGSGGCAVAGRLSEDSQTSVALLDAGGK